MMGRARKRASPAIEGKSAEPEVAGRWRVLGIDPGYERTGFAVLERSNQGGIEVIASGTIETAKEIAYPQRLLIIYKCLRSIIKKHAPNELAIEQLFYGKNAKTAIRVAQARGVVILTAEMLGIPLFEYSPRKVKLLLQGSGNATKDQVRYMVRQSVELGNGKMFDDEIDALAVALVHADVRSKNLCPGKGA